MAEQQEKNTVPELERIELEPKEIMRLSVFETEDGYGTAFLTDGTQGPMMEAFINTAGYLDLICLPKPPKMSGDEKLPIAVVVCSSSNLAKDSKQEESKADSTPQED